MEFTIHGNVMVGICRSPSTSPCVEQRPFFVSTSVAMAPSFQSKLGSAAERYPAELAQGDGQAGQSPCANDEEVPSSESSTRRVGVVGD